MPATDSPTYDALELAARAKALDTSTVAGIINSILTAVQTTAAASAGSDPVPVSQDSNAMYAGITKLTPKFAPISASNSADIVALVAAKKIRVLSLFVVTAGATTVKFRSGGTVDLTGAMSFAANGGISLPFNPVGWFETAAGAKLDMVLGSAVAVAGGLTYIEV